MGQWWCGPVTETAGVGDKGPGNLGVSQQRREGPGVRTGEAGPGGWGPPTPVQACSAPLPWAGHGPSRWSRHLAPLRAVGGPLEDAGVPGVGVPGRWAQHQ